MTLDQLAAASGLDKGYLSRIERQSKTPSITSLMKIADAFGVDLSFLFGERLERSAINVVRLKDRISYGSVQSDNSYQAILQDDGDRHLSAFILIPGKNDNLAIGQHAGDEFIFVLKGAAEIEFADRSIILHEGDCVRFEGHLIHRVLPHGTDASELLVVIARDPGSRPG